MKESLQEQLARLTESGKLKASKSNSSFSSQMPQTEPKHEVRPKLERDEALLLEIDSLKKANQVLSEVIKKQQQDASIELNETLDRLADVIARLQSLEQLNQNLVAENLEIKSTIEQLPDEKVLLHWQEKIAQADALNQETRLIEKQVDEEKRQLAIDRSAFEVELGRLDGIDAEFEKLVIAQQKLLSAQKDLQRDISNSEQTRKTQSIENARLEKLSVELHALQARVGHLKGVDRSLKALEEEHAKQMVLSKRNKTRIRNLTTEKEQAVQDLVEVQAALKVTSRDYKKALKLLAEVPDAELIIRSFDTVQWLTSQFVDPRDRLVPKQVLLLGEGQWAIGNFAGLLQDLGFEIWQNGYNAEIEIVVVGRENWSELDLVRQINERDGRPIRVYSQELFVLMLAMQSDPLKWSEPEALLRFVRGHPAIEYLLDQEFPWPETTFEDGPPATIGEGFDGEDASSPLYKMGYSVAQQVALSQSERYQCLNETYQEENLPWCISDAYMEDWGEPNSRKRLRRIAWHLNMMTKRLKRHTEAVARWESDLNWLKQNYYKPIHRFRWPT